MALRSFEDNVCKEPSVVCVLFKRCARRFFSEDLGKTRSGVEYLKKGANIHKKCYLFRPGGHPLNTRSGVKYGFGPFCYFCMFYRRFPRSLGLPLRDALESLRFKNRPDGVHESILKDQSRHSEPFLGRSCLRQVL